MKHETIKAWLLTLAGMMMIVAGLSLLVLLPVLAWSSGEKSLCEHLWKLLLVGFAAVVAGIVVVEPKRVPPLIRAAQGFLPFFRTTVSGIKVKPDEDTFTIETDSRVLGAKAHGPAPDTWYRDLRPVLHQASHYSVPTYYLDTDLHLVDWNVAFELIFSNIIGNIRNQHVNFLIAKFDNRGDVIEHAREFTRRHYESGDLPLIDFEPICYMSEEFGKVDFLKVASQLHDADGRLRGWSAALIIRKIDWSDFERALITKLEQDKLWSVYSGPYDRILQLFPPYHDLIRDIVMAVPTGRRTVIDLGSGTGNVVSALLEAGHHVTAVESNIMMLDRLLSKRLDVNQLTVVKGAVDHLDFLEAEKFDAATMMNVLYAVDDPLACLNGIHRILKPGAVLSLSTTHSETRLDTLLGRIQRSLREQHKFEELAEDFLMLKDINKKIETSIARRHSREEYRDWVRGAGFEELRCDESTYEEAVMLIHARKK